MTVVVVALVFLLAASWVLLVVRERDAARERAFLIHAIFADTPAELAVLERATAGKPARRAKVEDPAEPIIPIGMA